MNESCHTYGRIMYHMSHSYVCHDPLAAESQRHRCVWEMSHVYQWYPRVSGMIASCAERASCAGRASNAAHEWDIRCMSPAHEPRPAHETNATWSPRDVTVLHMKLSCRICLGDMTQTSCHTYARVMAHKWICHVPRMIESHPTYEQVVSHSFGRFDPYIMSHIWMSTDAHMDAHMNASCPTYEWVTSLVQARTKRSVIGIKTLWEILAIVRIWIQISSSCGPYAWCNMINVFWSRFTNIRIHVFVCVRLRARVCVCVYGHVCVHLNIYM